MAEEVQVDGLPRPLPENRDLPPDRVGREHGAGDRAETGGYLAASIAATEARSAEKTAKQARDRMKPEATEFVNAVHAYLVGRLGETNESLKDFGFQPRKKAAPLAGEARGLKAAKAKATRQKRGTLGQKDAITGTAPGP